jgi:two-component system response regulator GlrR
VSETHEPTPPRVLVIDDDPDAGDVVSRHLRELGAQVASARNGEQALAAARSAPPDVILVDYYMDGETGLEVMASLRELALDARFILCSGGDAKTVAVDAMRAGAFDFISKPLVGAELRLRVGRALRDRQSAAQAGTDLVGRPARKSDLIIGGGTWIKNLYERLSMVAPTDVAVALAGESGTGKELVARTVHGLSPRADRPFVVVNCGAIPATLLEDELFGHVRGAFTDAHKDRDGLFSQADGGSLFLDEIGELPLALQVKLLRVLETHEFRRVGDERDRHVDVRIVTATNRDLEAEVAGGRFRQDLFYRINVFPITLPPLRDRPDDIVLLAHHFVLKHRSRLGKPWVEGFTTAALERLSGYGWPGNVRELENRVHHALVLAQGEWIGEELLQMEGGPLRSSAFDLARPFKELKRGVIEEFERGYLTRLLKHHRGNLAAAARQARVDRKNLWELVKKYDIDPKSFDKN